MHVLIKTKSKKNYIIHLHLSCVFECFAQLSKSTGGKNPGPNMFMKYNTEVYLIDIKT